MYVFSFTADQVALIGKGLDLLPHGQVRALVDSMQASINLQNEREAEEQSRRENTRIRSLAEELVELQRTRGN